MTEHLLGATIRATREDRGLSLRSFARGLGLSPATVSALERDQVPITVERTRLVAAALGTTVEALVRGEVLHTAGTREPGSGSWREYDDLAIAPVLEAASRVFVRQGYHAATMREVATEAGLPSPVRPFDRTACA